MNWLVMGQATGWSRRHVNLGHPGDTLQTGLAMAGKWPVLPGSSPSADGVNHSSAIGVLLNKSDEFFRRYG
ncbi:hypothetical protein Pan216_15540 [Planctomycetes bacterium Pan216]|uniref:Uncharacterized protein n=1 Tax=Kolteria novifilia TaxID=2527975 RepID=A0A518B162_9BACT|nr:hypothetical protein Pan216_15540 [Planctomycetes bacterium Pan216]